jgi:hypothetical protein
MLEAIVSTRYQGERGTKKRGDILVIKLAGSPWTKEERTRGQLVEWPDEPIAARLLSQVSASNPHPCVAYPYAEYDRDGEMILRSKLVVDIDALPTSMKQDVLNPTVEVKPLKRNEYVQKERKVK